MWKHLWLSLKQLREFYFRTNRCLNIYGNKIQILLCVFQARERDERERLKKQQELDDNMTEIANHVFGDVLTENPAVAQSAFGPHRVIPDRWKGMTPAQIEDVRRQQELQRQEKEVRNLFNFVIVFQIWHSCTSFIDQRYQTCPNVFNLPLSSF